MFVNNRRLAERVALRINELAQERKEAAEADAQAALEAEHGATVVAAAARGDAAPPDPLEVADLGGGQGPSYAAPRPPAPAEIARAHHGSLAREERQVVEELLKSGELPCLIATSSLELGIDMGAVDLVIQIESPKSVSRGLQRIGRAGHTVDQVAKGRIFPKFRADLLECAVVASRMRDGDIETTTIPKNPLDVLAQQIVAIVAAADRTTTSRRRKPAPAPAPTLIDPDDPSLGDAEPGDDAGVSADAVLVDEVEALIRRAYPFRDLPRSSLEAVLDLLDGRYPSAEFSELRPRLVWDRVAGTLRARRGARQLAIVNAGTIPDRGLYMVTLPDGRRVGELDEEMVHEARPGQTFLLGASSWRIEEIQRDRVIVTPRPACPGRSRSGAATLWAGRASWVRRSASSPVRPSTPSPRRSPRSTSSTSAPPATSSSSCANSAMRRPSSRATARSCSSGFRDEIGDWRLVLLSPMGGRVHAAWALAIGARIREELGLESDVIWSDEGLILHLPDSDEIPSAELILIEPEQLEELVVRELGASALFGSRFRENSARALLLRAPTRAGARRCGSSG